MQQDKCPKHSNKSTTEGLKKKKSRRCNSPVKVKTLTLRENLNELNQRRK